MSCLTDLRAQGLEIASRGDWGARFDYTTERSIYLPGRYLFLHISVTRLTPDWRADMRTIENIGISRFPNTGISYNAAAFPDGRIADAQPLTRRGAHTINDLGVAGYPTNLNYYGHAIVLPQMVGDQVTDTQVDAVARWGAAVVRAGYSTASEFLPHRMFAPKDCPGDKAVARLDDINRLLRHYIVEGLDTDMELTDKVQLAGEHAGQILGVSEITVDGALGYAAASLKVAENNATALAEIKARLDQGQGSSLSDADVDRIAARVLDLHAQRLQA